MQISLFSAMIVAFSCLTAFDRVAYYESFGSEEPAAMEAMLEKIGATPELSAFAGALQMRMAHFAGKPKDKLALFRAGREKLEAAIAVEPNNPEYRFLRYCVQSYAPKVVKYQGDMDADRAVLEAAYPDLPHPLKKYVEAFARREGTLQLKR